MCTVAVTPVTNGRRNGAPQVSAACRAGVAVVTSAPSARTLRRPASGQDDVRWASSQVTTSASTASFSGSLCGSWNSPS